LLEVNFPAIVKTTRKRRGRPRSILRRDESLITNVILEGRNAHNTIAILCEWKNGSAPSWQPLSSQSADFQEWWAEERELRYPELSGVEYRVRLTGGVKKGFWVA
jgi:hypothetical protein